MKRFIKIGKISLGVAILAALAAILAGLQAETAEAAKPKSLWVEPLSFVPFSSTSEWTFHGAFVYGTSLYAPVTLPAGKKITGITIYYLDEVAEDLCVNLSIRFVGAVYWQGLGATCSSGAQSQPSSSQIVYPTPYKLKSGEMPFLSATFGAYDPGLRLLDVAVQYK